MLYWSRFPYIRFLIFFITGIVLYRNLSLKIPYLIPLFFALFMVYLFLIRVSVKKRFIRFNFLIGLCAMVLFTLSGYLITWENDDRRFPDHLLNKSAEIEACLGKIIEINQEDRSGIRLVSDCRLVKIKGSWEPADGRIFIIIKKSGPAAPGPLGPGDWIVFAGSPLKIDPPRNPGQFNYSAYMAERNIFYRLYLKPGRVKIVQRAAGFNPIRMAEKLNSAFRNILAVHIREREALGLVAALTLGSKDQLDDTVEQDYAKAGISHILAVSGLHVGILYMVILILIKPLYKNAKFGWTGSLIVLGILIAFAFITGLKHTCIRHRTGLGFTERYVCHSAAAFKPP